MVIDLRLLRQFTVVAEELHYGRAAERLGMTQPPLSQAIRRLEQDIGAPLFDRNKRSVKLTTAGKAWLPHVYRLLEQSADLAALAHGISSGDEGALDLAFLSMTAFSVLPELLCHYQNEHPNVILKLRELPNEGHIAAIVDKKVDAGLFILADNERLGPSLEQLPIRTEYMMMAIPQAWVDEGRVAINGSEVTFVAVDRVPIIRIPRESAPELAEKLDRFYSRMNFIPTVVQNVSQSQSLVGLVSAGFGMTMVPESLHNFRRVGVCYVDVKNRDLTVTISLVWRRDRTSPLLQGFIESSKQFAKMQRQSVAK